LNAGRLNDNIAMANKKLSNLNFKYIPVPNYAIKDRNLNPLQKLILGQIILLAQKEGYCYASNEKLAGMLAISKSVISDGISNLKKNNYISTKGTFNRKIYVNYELIRRINTDVLRESTYASPRIRGEVLPESAENIYKENTKEKKNNKKSKTRTSSSRSNFSFTSRFTNKDIDLVLLLKNKDQFREYFLDFLVWIFDELPMIDYKTLFWIINDFNSEHRPSELKEIISDEGLEDYIIGIIDEYSKKGLIETSDDHDYFDRFDKQAIGYVDRLHKFLHEMIVE
jgi:DNA-binding MarR family transcriptional regulator